MVLVEGPLAPCSPASPGMAGHCPVGHRPPGTSVGEGSSRDGVALRRCIRVEYVTMFEERAAFIDALEALLLLVRSSAVADAWG